MVALLELKGIRKSYGGSKDVAATEVLHGIDLTIEAGEFVAIVGSSGSGKSTLMHILGCLDRPSAGQYWFQGRDVSVLSADELAWLRREAFGFVFQSYHLIATETARENVEIPAVYAGVPDSERAELASNLLARLGLQQRTEYRPDQLSGGQQQRVSIARALMNGGHIILADEPTGALDSVSGKEVMALLQELAAAGHTIILITHDQQVARQAQRVIEIHDGRIISDSGSERHCRGLSSSAPAPAPAKAVPVISAASTGVVTSDRALIREAVKSAWRLMLQNRVRTFLTLLGIIIGVAAVIVILAVGQGARQDIIHNLSAMGSNLLYVGGRTPLGGGPRGVLTLDDIAAIEALPQIRRTLPILRDPALARYGSISVVADTLATTEVMPQINHWPVAEGRFINAQDNRDIAPVVVLGSKMKAQLFGDEEAVGKQLLLGDSPFDVIGVMSEKGASGNEDADRYLIVPYQTGVVRLFPLQRDEGYAVIEASSSDVVYQAEEAIRQLLLQRHGREDFWLGNAADRLAAELATRNTLTLLLGLTALVSLVLGGAGVMNVMLMTVRERTREIGIRMATGARRLDILRQFLTEAVLVTLVGGSLGVVLGISFGMVLLLCAVPVVFSVSSIGMAFGCAVLTGLLFGYLPARQAARQDPVTALAGE